MANRYKDYRVYDYDIISEPEGYYSVNNVFPTDYYIRVRTNVSNGTIIKLLKKLGVIGKALHISKFEIHGEPFFYDGHMQEILYIDYLGNPFCEIRVVHYDPTLKISHIVSQYKEDL